MFANTLYIIALTIVSPIVLYRNLRHGRYRRGIGEKLLGLSRERAKSIRGNRSQCLWIHAVSVGEVNLLPGIVQRLSSSQGDVSIAVSTSTDTGYDVAVKHFGADRVFFCPLDFSWAVKRTLRNLSPTRLILAELELWPNLIRCATESDCPVLVMNARLSEKSAAGYQRFSMLTRSTFQRLAWVGCQDEACSRRFLACGTPADQITVTGSLKFDDAPTSRDNNDVTTRQQWAGIDPWHRVWMFGSTQAGEEVMALRIYQSIRQQYPDLRLILVPRHPERFDAVASLVVSHGLRVHRRSIDESLYDDQWNNDTVILIDTVGELRHWWGVSQIATVGGSFGDRGGQNMLEPAGYGCAVSFGPNTRNFAEIADRLIQGNGAVRVVDEEALRTFVIKCIDDIPAADALGHAATEVIRSHRGASQRTVAEIEAALKSRPAQKPLAA
ncbi:MAG: 3-deoxy-D-manno-octulosonic acid transferase [Pirellulaceae bacterium]|nr:3-deoxy-D-manno-octulosonic acid transferase [Pirellulaceae bacterium]